MISFFVAGAIGLLALQAGIDGPRKAFVACLKEAAVAAESQKVAQAGYGAFILQRCDAQAGSLKSALIGFDVKNGIRRTQASADAQAQVDDYVATSTEKYETKMAVAKPKAAPPAVAVAPSATPTPTPAAAPKN
jgi:hypothetical protein